MLKLYHNDMSSCAQKVRFVLHEKRADWESEELNLRTGDQLKPEFLKINPKGLVPALEHDGKILIESNVIIEYLNEAFPDPALLPVDPYSRALVRGWMKRLDDGIHLETIVLSFGVAFRHQLIAALDTDEALERHFSSIPDPYIQEVQRQVVPDGIGSPRFEQAITAFEKLLRELDSELASHAWIVGDKLTLADIAYAPYGTRLEHLHLHGMWDNKPNYARWYDALKATPGYQAGLTQWFNPNYLPLMDKAGSEAWPRIEKLIAAVNA
jgi:glutathione S-transferase